MYEREWRRAGAAAAGRYERLYLSDEATEAEAAAASDPHSHACFADGYKIAWEEGDEVAIERGTPYPVQQDETGRWYVELPSAESYRSTTRRSPKRS